MELNGKLSLEDPTEFNVAKYKLDRETEREVYKAIGDYEHAGLRALLVLNGGAATAFLALLGAVWGEKNLPPGSITWATVAIAMWTIGLFLTGGALRCMYHAHRSLTLQYRFRRFAEEVDKPIPSREFKRYVRELTYEHLVDLHDRLVGTKSDVSLAKNKHESRRNMERKIRQYFQRDTIWRKEMSTLFIDQVIGCENKYKVKSKRGRLFAYGAGLSFILGVIGALLTVRFLATGTATGYELAPISSWLPGLSASGPIDRPAALELILLGPSSLTRVAPTERRSFL